MGRVAFEFTGILRNLPVKIECYDTWGNKLIIGTNEGVLLVYEIQEGTDMQLADTKKGFSKKPISQLTVIQELNILISLSDGIISIHSLVSFQPISVLTRLQGCSLYSMNNKHPPDMCACVKKKLVILSWENNNYIQKKELAIPDTPKVIVWCGPNLCLGFKKEYNLIHVHNSSMSELFPTGNSKTAIVTSLPSEELLLSKDNISIFIDFNGKPTRRSGITWSDIPIAISYSFPYVIALLPRFVEVRTIETQTLVQTLSIKALFIENANSGIVYVANQNNVWRLEPVSLFNQIDSLIEENEFGEAIKLCELAPYSDKTAKEEKIKNIRVKYAFSLFEKGDYDNSMSHFQEMDFDPRIVIALFPTLIPKDVKIDTSGDFIFRPIRLEGQDLEKALLALIDFLTFKRKSISPPNSTTNVDQPYSQLFQSATYLPQIIDTTLLKAYLAANGALVVPLLRMQNYCHVEEAESILLAQQKLQELVLLYKSKGLHKKALTLLSKHAQPSSSKDKVAQLDGLIETVHYLQTLGPANFELIAEYSKWVLQTNPTEGLKIFTEDGYGGVQRPGELLHDQVLSHLKDKAPALCNAYLEHIIFVKHNTNPEFHNLLVFDYLRVVLEDINNKRVTFTYRY
jgi:hypothetical protein